MITSKGSRGSRRAGGIAALLLAAGLSGSAHAPAARAADSTLSVTIIGPTTVRPGEQCMWLADVSGGTTPYSYTWGTAHADYEQPSGDAILAGADHPGQMRIDVDVTDAGSGFDSAFLYVDLDDGAPSCM